MKNPPTPPPSGPSTQDAVARVGRLRVLQLAVVAVLAGLVVVVTLVSSQELLNAQRGQSRAGDLQGELVRFRDDSRVVQISFWESQYRNPGALPPTLAFDLVQLVGRARLLADRERELDPGGQGAVYGEKVASGLETVITMTQEYLEAPTLRARQAIVEEAMEGPVAQIATDSAAWSEYGIQRERERSHAQAHRIQELVMRVAVLVTLLIGAGVIGYVMLGRARSRLVDHLTSVAREQAALRRVATVVAETQVPEDAFAVLVEEVSELLGGRAAVVRCERAAAQLVAASPPVEEPDEQMPLDEDGVLGRAVRAGAAVRVPAEGGGVTLACPIQVAGRAWGVVTAEVGGAAAGVRDGLEEVLVPFARLAAVSVTDAEVRRQLAERASTDPLTRLPNHGAFQERLGEETSRALAEGTPLALVVLDLDRFKSINDGFGHQVGDRVLAEAAGRLRSLCREGEMLARVGGEEFAWILPDTDLEGAMAAANRGRTAIGERPFPDVGRLTISAGVCDLTQAGTAAEIFRRADAALLAAKRGGRDMAVPHTGDAEEATEAGTARLGGRVRRIRTPDALRALARAVDARDRATHAHSERVGALAERLAATLGWSDDRVRLLREAGLVHDVGKIGIPDSVLLSSRTLTAEEMNQVRAHAELGAQIVADVLTREQTEWVRHHHERIDGRGYPDGLAGTAIPHGARILAVADAWDAMTSDRPHRPARSREEAMEECRRVAGSQLDADVVAALERVVGTVPEPAGIPATALLGENA